MVYPHTHCLLTHTLTLTAYSLTQLAGGLVEALIVVVEVGVVGGGVTVVMEVFLDKGEGLKTHLVKQNKL